MFSGSDSSLQIATNISNKTVFTTNDDGAKNGATANHGTMIGCDNEKCSIGWFHIDCLKNLPSGNQIVGRICKYLCCSGGRLGCKYVPSRM